MRANVWVGWLLAGALSACGGGGGEAGEVIHGTLSPQSTLVVVQHQGTAETLRFAVSFQDAFDLANWHPALVADASTFDASSASVLRQQDGSWMASIRTLGTLPLGQRTGSLQVTLCADAACSISRQVSAGALGYTITVVPAAQAAL